MHFLLYMDGFQVVSERPFVQFWGKYLYTSYVLLLYHSLFCYSLQ